jgi:hypothetical protein
VNVNRDILMMNNKMQTAVNVTINASPVKTKLDVRLVKDKTEPNIMAENVFVTLVILMIN